VLTLIARAEELVDQRDAEQMERKLREASFTLEDFLQQLQQVKKMGPLNQVLGMLPGMSRELKDVEVDDRDLGRVEAIIRSMTPSERKNPKILNGSRRARIAKGSGTTTQQVNAVIKQFDEARKMMKQLAGMNPKRLRKLGLSR
jgi:signal recognition particle subunit SRP54